MMKRITLFVLIIAALACTATTLQEELTYYLDRHSVQDEGYDMVANYAQRGHTMLEHLPREPLRLMNIGHWRGIKRQGTGMEQDSIGRVVIGHYEEDTLTSGLRLDTTAIYAGSFAGTSQANGHGCCLSADNSYYEGHWVDDLRHGFGFSVAPMTHIRVGQWIHDKFLGERVQYNSERIYGIDISRYQHGHGRKKYPILWDKLHISYLGHNSQKNATDTVNYPVSFIFIKSTESTNIANPYYKADYTQARRRGIPIGAYHFFSHKTSGSAQARHFLNKTVFRKGDLPPVLDLELAPWQIKAMGGTQAMFHHVRVWLQTVEQRVHVKPILYVSQQFINQYFSEAPDLKRDHLVWIARYSEYKPDVKLALWQFSSNGRVTGITGTVDINVFNGYQTQWEEFLQEMAIK